MPKAESASNKSGLSVNANEKMHEYVEPHERKDGPWEEHELENAGRHLEHAENIKENPKFVEAIAKHHEAKAKHHRELATEMKHYLKRGLVSEEALKKAFDRHGTQTAANEGKGRREMAPPEKESHGNRDQSQSKEKGNRGPEHLAKVKGKRR
jgi:hypothetical protein